MSAPRGSSTRVVRAGLPDAVQGEPFLPGPVLASAFHLAGDDVHATHGYHREGSPTWERYETALAELEGGECVLFSSGMAAASAVLLRLGPGDVLVAPSDCYGAVRTLASEHLAPRGVEVRLVPTEQGAVAEAMVGATLVWVETPSNPGLAVLDVEALAAASGDALLAVDNTLATPLRQRPLELGADLSMCSDSKHLTGHSDLLLGHVAARDPALVAELRSWRTLTGAIAGPLETWLAHRSLATLAVRLERQTDNARAVVELLRARDDVDDVRWPGDGTVLGFTLGDAAAVTRFFAASELVTEATSFGGVHTTAERRARWGFDDIAEGWVRFSAGIEDAEDLLADVGRALDAAAAG